MSCVFDVCVIGGGAAGMMCAYTAAERGLKVLLLDSNYKLGKKLRITGKGRCNITNNCDIKTFMNNVPTNSKFLYSSINRFSPNDTIDFFIKNGLPLKTERGNRVFPVSDNANDVADLLINLCKKAGVVVINRRAEAFDVQNGLISGIICGNEIFSSKATVLCTGGMSYPLTGSNGTGYKLAKSVGHSIIPVRPALVPLESDDDCCSQMQGFSARNVELRLYENDRIIFKELGELLFTHFGISGPLALSASSHIKKIREESYTVSIDFKPGLDIQKLDARVLRDFAKYNNRELKNALSDLCVSSMIPVIIDKTGINGDIKVNSITKEQRQALVNELKDFRISISGFRPIDEAIISSGGINVKEINPRTMQSKIIQNLYFAGEIIDVDAYTGGFNLQIAWSTGRLAGLSVLS